MQNLLLRLKSKEEPQPILVSGSENHRLRPEKKDFFVKHPMDFAADAEALIARMDLSVRASLLSGSSFWHLQGVADHGLPKVMVADGPHGLR
ncbi:MAG: hypothetical protein VXY43_00500, partial [Pseudomonadota bacterium]|nr:hypothetical protein [Pseudomonadota bacterium]